MRPSSSDRARPSPCSPETDPPSDNEIGRLLDERPVRGNACRTEQVEMIRMCMQPSPKWPYDAPRRPPHQPVEAPQVVGEAFRRHGRVLPAAPRLCAVGAAGREAGRVRPAPPQHRLSRGVTDQGIADAGEPESRRASKHLRRTSRRAHHPPGPFHQQPARPAGRTRPRSPPGAPRARAAGRRGRC